jgi:hypothetical protein
MWFDKQQNLLVLTIKICIVMIWYDMIRYICLQQLGFHLAAAVGKHVYT